MMGGGFGGGGASGMMMMMNPMNVAGQIMGTGAAAANGQMMMMMDLGFDGKMLRKSMARRTVDYHPSVVNYLEDRVWKRDGRDVRSLQSDALYGASLTLPDDMLDTQVSCVMSKFIRAALNKDPRPIFCIVSSHNPFARSSYLMLFIYMHFI